MVSQYIHLKNAIPFFKPNKSGELLYQLHMNVKNIFKTGTFFALAFLASGLISCASKKSGSTTKAEDITFNNPLAEQRADPWVWKDEDGTYYFIATAPEYDRIILRKAKTINGIKDAEEKVIWTKHKQGVMGAHIWAPELHKIDGKWYIYFAAGEAENIWAIRMWVLSNDNEDPTEGEWKEEGRIVTQETSFSLDATTFENNGSQYLIWAQNVSKGPHGTSLLLSKMKDPVTLEGPELVITNPELPWETVGYNVNEGPAVLKKNGKIFVSYSASATDHNYAIGLLWADENSDLMDIASWHKSQEPVFFTNDSLLRYGPGHSCFTVAEDGKTDVLIYHARTYKELQGNPLTDPNRHTRARILRWTEDGMPDFGQDLDD